MYSQGTTILSHRDGVELREKAGTILPCCAMFSARRICLFAVTGIARERRRQATPLVQYLTERAFWEYVTASNFTARIDGCDRHANVMKGFTGTIRKKTCTRTIINIFTNPILNRVLIRKPFRPELMKLYGYRIYINLTERTYSLFPFLC